jgi:hypothetical protein
MVGDLRLLHRAMSDLGAILLLQPVDMVLLMSSPPTTFTIFTDVSNLAEGVTSVTQEATSLFNAKERELLITWKELSAVSRALENQASLLQNKQD